MKKFFLFIAFNMGCYILVAQNADSLWIVNNYDKMEQLITMRDGIKLFTSIYFPKDNSVDHPILMERTPYSCSPYGKEKWKNYWNSYLKAYFKEGYIMVKQDVNLRISGPFVPIRNQSRILMKQATPMIPLTGW
jgi:hypothetical protein